MFKFEEYSVVSSVKLRAFDHTETFSGINDRPLTFAFGISKLNEDLGTMKAFYESWDPTGKTDGIVPVLTRNCTAEDFGINVNKTNAGFSKPFEEDYPIRQRIMSSMRCIDKDEKLSIKGDWDTATSKVLLLLFERCDNKTRATCKSDDELKSFLKRKNFIFSYNKLTFDEKMFDDDKVI